MINNISKTVGESVFSDDASSYIYLNSNLANATLLLNDDLGVSGDSSREFGGQSECLVERVGMQRLGASEHTREGLDCRSNDIVVGVLMVIRR